MELQALWDDLSRQPPVLRHRAYHQQIIYAYEMDADGARISVTLATIEFAKNGDGTALAWTEQGAYLDGIDGDEATALRREGTQKLIDNLTVYLNGQAPQ
jgi:Activator of Hsp90 ATPase homolog 1-like protein